MVARMNVSRMKKCFYDFISGSLINGSLTQEKCDIPIKLLRLSCHGLVWNHKCSGTEKETALDPTYVLLQMCPFPPVSKSLTSYLMESPSWPPHLWIPPAISNSVKRRTSLCMASSVPIWGWSFKPKPNSTRPWKFWFLLPRLDPD